MKRSIINQLVAWKNRVNRMPLLIRGARQTGKTYIVEWFGREHFDQIVVINFELNPELKQSFEQLDPVFIVRRLEVMTGKKIIARHTLLFFDEIQECPEAIHALRYFKEKMPALHVIGAGSLLEFVMDEPTFRFPVGRIECLYLYPLCFSEFLVALGENHAAEFLQQASYKTAIPEEIHQKLLELTRLYFVIGGMPAVIQSYLEEADLQRVQQLQAFILNTYRNDFGKYASGVNQAHCRRIFEKAPQLVAKQLKYVDIDPDIQSRSLKAALKLLMLAGVLSPVYASAATGLPLCASINEKKFKLLFLDVGLVKYSAGLDAKMLLQRDLLLINKGAIAEQFVGQELIATQPNYDAAKLFFWQRHKKNSSAELDYLIQQANQIIPIEVKAGVRGRLKSLQIFMADKQLNLGIKISEDNLSYKKNVLSLPLYMISQLNRMIEALVA
jgi:uncharacterized protein